MSLHLTRRLLKSLIKRNYSQVAAVPTPNLAVKNTEIFINNEWQKSKSGKTFNTINPATGEIIAEIQQGSKEDIDLAVEAAYEAFKFNTLWRTMDASDRGVLLHKLADLIEQHASHIATLETLDTGKPFQSAFEVDVGFSLKILRYYAGWADKYHGRTIPVDGSFFAYTRHEPVGVCGQIIPWNVPFLMFILKIAPALSMGNTVVLKPAEQTPLSALYVAQLIKEAGIPPGVVNIVPGYSDAGQALVSNQKVDKIAFTGSTEVGSQIQNQSGVGNLKRTTLELGGKSPNIILADANIDQAVELAHQAVFFNQGQICFAGSRTFIHESIYDEFVEKSVERAKKRVVGDPFDPKTEQGPQIDGIQMEKVLDLIKKGKNDGAKLLTGGGRIGQKGFFLEPTVFAEVEDHHTIAKEEIFGPVQQLIRFKNLDEVIERANKTNYGLAAGIVSQDIDKINYLIQGIKAGIIWVNTYMAITTQAPFGGYKNSGLGREFGIYGLQQYTEIKSVIQAIQKKNS